VPSESLLGCFLELLAPERPNSTAYSQLNEVFDDACDENAYPDPERGAVGIRRPAMTLVENPVHPSASGCNVDKPSGFVEMVPRRVGREAHVGAPRCSVRDLINQCVEDCCPDAATLMLRKGRHISNQEVPPAVPRLRAPFRLPVLRRR
jgi:hypothetical protein